MEPRVGPKALSFEEFKSISRKVHSGKYLYPDQPYENSRTKVKIICPNHGEFIQVSGSHSRGAGCSKCRDDSKKYTVESLQTSICKIFETSLLIPEQPILSSKDKVKVICKKHGEFLQSPKRLMWGFGCPVCSKEQRKYSYEDFKLSARSVHGDKYEYPDQDFVSSREHLTVICPKHGPWKTNSSNHLSGHGCPRCNTFKISNLEKDLISKLPKCEANFRLSLSKDDFVRKLDSNLVRHIELDAFFPDKNVAVEFNGLYWHSEEVVGQHYHLDKTKICNSKGIDLIQVFEDEWLNKPEIVLSIINSRLGIYEERLYARKTLLKKIESSIANSFYEVNHIQGKASASEHYGLYFKDELVSCCSFGIRRGLFGNSTELELIRFCSKLNTSVVGALSKLLAVKKGLKIKSYCDRRLFNGSGYIKAGFIVTSESRPSYFYTKDRKRWTRFNFQKHKLSKMLPVFDEGLSEVDNMRRNGYLRIFDCGTLVMVKDGT